MRYFNLETGNNCFEGFFSFAVRQLAKKHRMAIPTFSHSRQSEESTSKESEDTSTDKMEIPVAYGRWGKPRCLLEAKYDFLILDATVASTLDPLDRVQIGMFLELILRACVALVDGCMGD